VSSSYLVLARKYRPQNFNELIGQDVLVKTLTNAIKNNRLHHAYILTGIRGVGKTTSARIIAKTLNCTNIEANQQAKACGVCDNCKLIANSHHQDVLEIDAASRTGVDDIREIIDSIAYSAVLAKYKIYIIDEVHMLSNNAFNALLKTLEEPPAHVKFIFATTEIRKVPITILSRCQRFDLRRLDEKEIVDHLKNVLQKENFSAEDLALELIAKFSEGSVRDSLSLLDRALATNNHDSFLPAIVVEEMLGVNDRFKIIELFEFLLTGQFRMALDKFLEIYSFTSDISQILQDLIEVNHRSILTKLLKDYKIEGYSKNQNEKIFEIANKVDISILLRIYQLITKSISEINFSLMPKNSFEVLLARICHIIAIPDLKSLLIDLNKTKNNTDNHSQLKNNRLDNEEELIKEILKNFEGSKIL
jgi:DNA polymerase-3 subunit gamma/tau